MKNKIVISIISLVLMFLLITTNYSSATSNNDEEIQEYQKIIQELFTSRVSVWDDTIKNQYNTNEIKEKLEKYLADPQLTEDVNDLNNLINNPTDIEIIKDISIKNVEFIVNEDDVTTFKVLVKWNVENLENTSNEEICYKVKLLKDNNNYRLYDYELFLE